MTTLQDTREECLRWLEDPAPVVPAGREARGPVLRARLALRRLFAAPAVRPPARAEGRVELRRAQTQP